MEKLRVDWDDLDIKDCSGTAYYQGQYFTGWACDFFEDGRIQDETEFRDGAQTGLSRTYDRHGRLLREEHYLNSNLHGYARSWHINGQLASEELYQGSVLMKERQWDMQGTLIRDYHIDPQDSRIEFLKKLNLYKQLPD
jgi:antitoxin component YwqK of YwqJK toxin-antitoxin module